MWFWHRRRAKRLLKEHRSSIREYFNEKFKGKISCYYLSNRTNRKVDLEAFERWKKMREAEAAKRKPFRTLVLEKMDEMEFTSKDLHKYAGIDRKLFSKLKTNPEYRPTVDTVVRYCLAFRLNEKETEEWMKSAGYELSNTSTFDLVIRYCIEKEIYDPIDVNILLDSLGKRILR